MGRTNNTVTRITVTRDYDFSVGSAREIDVTWGGRLELGTCHGCGYDAMLTIGADPLKRRCVKCWMRKTLHWKFAEDARAGSGARRNNYRLKKCRKRGCANLVAVRKDTSGFCCLHAQTRRGRVPQAKQLLGASPNGKMDIAV